MWLWRKLEMMIECCLLYKINTAPIIFIIQTSHRYSCTICHSPSSSASLTMLPACCWIVPRRSVEHIPLSHWLMTFLSFFIKALALSSSSDCLCLSPSVPLLFQLLGKTYQWTQGTLFTTSCRFKTNYTGTKTPQKIQTLCWQASTLPS